MCIICIKPSGVIAPTKEVIATMFDHNPDGFGFMHNGNGYVQIEKGFMKLKDVEKRLAKLYKEIDAEKTTIVYHFRITTSGGSKAGNTHPFPISPKVDDIKSLSIRCPIGMVHNGIIDIDHPIDMSDTMSFVKNELCLLYRSNKKFYLDNMLMKMIEHRVGSKLAFLVPSGETYTVGTFEEDGGLLFSNSTYKTSRYAYMYEGYEYDKWEQYYDKRYPKLGGGTLSSSTIRQVAMDDKYFKDDEFIGNDGGEWVYKGQDENGKTIYSWVATATNDSAPFSDDEIEDLTNRDVCVFEFPKVEGSKTATNKLGKTANRFMDNKDSEYELLMELTGKSIEVEMSDSEGTLGIIEISGIANVDFAIDKDGYIYEFDFSYRTYSPTLEKGLRFWSDGDEVIFDEKLAEWEVVW